MTDSTSRIYFDPTMIEHRPGRGHPERPQRLEAIEAALEGRFPDRTLHSADPISPAALHRVHDPNYVDEVLALRGQQAVLDADTIVSPKSVDAALLAAGMAATAVEWTVAEQRPSFALVRPPGHHAERARGMGFCIFNNIAVAAAYARAELDVDRVMIVDWDVHHGNGTQNAFYDRGDVLFFSTHQAPFYPGTGAVEETGTKDGKGATINVPLPAGTGDAALVEAFETLLVPAAEQFDPQLVLVSAGFDAHCLDPVGGMQATTDGFAALLSIIEHLADRCCGGRLALVLEGGYHLEALARTVVRCIEVLDGGDGKKNFGSPIEPARRALQRARELHGW